MKFLNIQKNKKGFTLIEMLVAVFIFSLALTALIKVSARGLRSARGAENTTIAEFLAVDSMERVRSYRDTLLLQDPTGISSWNDIVPSDCRPAGLSSPGSVIKSAACAIYDNDDIPQNTIYRCAGSCNVLKNSAGAYANSFSGSSTQTQFTRELYFIYPDAGGAGEQKELVVESKVAWPGGEVSYINSFFLWN